MLIFPRTCYVLSVVLSITCLMFNLDGARRAGYHWQCQSVAATESFNGYVVYSCQLDKEVVPGEQDIIIPVAVSTF